MDKTLEEAALKFANDNSELYESSNHGSMYFGFYWGAQWQKERSYTENQMDDAYDKGFKDAFERMYSEQEVLDIILNFIKRKKTGLIVDYADLEEWLNECELKKK